MADKSSIGIATGTTPVYGTVQKPLTSNTIANYFTVTHSGDGFQFYGSNSMSTSRTNSSARTTRTTFESTGSWQALYFEYKVFTDNVNADYLKVYKATRLSSGTGGTECILDTTGRQTNNQAFFPSLTIQNTSHPNAVSFQIIFEFTSTSQGEPPYVEIRNMQIKCTEQTGTKPVCEAKEIKAIYLGGANNKPITIQQVLANRSGQKKVLFEYCKHTRLTTTYSWVADSNLHSNPDACTATSTCLDCGKVLVQKSTKTEKVCATLSGTCSDGYRWDYEATFDKYNVQPSKCLCYQHGYSSADNSHRWGDWTTKITPTCVGTGSRSHTCKDCGYSASQSLDRDPSNHASLSSKTTITPTCTATGLKTYTCSACNASWTEELPKISHTYNYVLKTKSPTCTTDGYTYYQCLACSYENVQSRLPAKHDCSVTDSYPVLGKDGLVYLRRWYNCKNCSYSYYSDTLHSDYDQ